MTSATINETPDASRHYLHDLDHLPSLTAEEEIEYAKRIEVGLYAGELLAASPDLEESARTELETLRAQGEAAKQQMILRNLSLVVDIARTTRRKVLPLEDRIAEGNLGLIHAVEKFDYAQGNRFCTYATWWIKQKISRSQNNTGHMIRLPDHVHDVLNSADATARALEAELGREPTLADVAAETGIAEQDLAQLRQVRSRPLSLNKRVAEDGSELHEVLASPAPDVADAVVERDLIRELLTALPPIQAQVLALRYGLADGHPCSSAQVAHHLQLSRRRIIQLEGQALKTLRGHDLAALLADRD
ncbi:sigma-70 family RNA polymerase sigma factor [Nonomuraea dietziae]|uniref:RNA polymerase sigma factor (Sigma-70 family) n=1 Tax=Nonomuraea dietziae TaxID=65515 RepID=A0A7W5YTF6_9ACTN|nr:sigma-70 family RNA polymerase sigma factor [Nonomuraea dietziae]MBB3734047.1 RNA polymerase sigma factor (sigma-70 family) [Nonomuraea dietziae]